LTALHIAPSRYLSHQWPGGSHKSVWSVTTIRLSTGLKICLMWHEILMQVLWGPRSIGKYTIIYCVEWYFMQMSNLGDENMSFITFIEFMLELVQYNHSDSHCCLTKYLAWLSCCEFTDHTSTQENKTTHSMNWLFNLGLNSSCKWWVYVLAPFIKFLYFLWKRRHFFVVTGKVNKISFMFFADYMTFPILSV
jgi:hypothetical protein